MGCTHRGGREEEEKPRVYSRDFGDTGMIRLKGIKANSFIRFLWIMEKIRAFKVLLEANLRFRGFLQGTFCCVGEFIKVNWP